MMGANFKNRLAITFKYSLNGGLLRFIFISLAVIVVALRKKNWFLKINVS